MSSLNAGDTAPAGTYTCASCSSSITVDGNEPLPTCSNCGGTTWFPGGGRASVKDPKPVGSI